MADQFTTSGMTYYEGDLTALNNSGVSGHATLLLDANAHNLTVDVQATGLEPGQVHIAHIHGFTDGTVADSPTLAEDTDHDGFVELSEGAASYGPILLNLSTNPDDSAHDHGTTGHDHTADAMFQAVTSDGKLNYHETFHFDPADPNAAAVLASLLPLGTKEIVVHGETVPAGSGAGTTGEVDGTAGYKLVLPVTSGELSAIGNAMDAVDAAATFGGQGIDWSAVAHQAEANFAATGHWFL